VKPGRPFELYADPSRLKLPKGGMPQAHVGFDGWSREIQDAPLLPAGLPRACGAGAEWLAGLAYAPEGARTLQFAVTDGTTWDNNGGQDYELPVGP